MFDKSDDEIIGYLEDQGAVIWDGIAPNGESVFRFDLDRLKEVMPEMYKEVMEDIDNDLMQLYNQGLVDIEYDEELNAMFRLTEKGKQWSKDFPLPPFPFLN